MIDVFNLIAFSILFVLNVTFCVFFVRSRLAHKNTIVKLIETSLLAEAYRQKLGEEIGNRDTKSLEQTEGFLKFISDSRDWAFGYIEEVQQALQDFALEIEPTIEWSKTYGIVNGDNAHTEALEKISLAYDKLKSVLPEENETPNN
jgi:hypothetical protein